MADGSRDLQNGKHPKLGGPSLSSSTFLGLSFEIILFFCPWTLEVWQVVVFVFFSSIRQKGTLKLKQTTRPGYWGVWDVHGKPAVRGKVSKQSCRKPLSHFGMSFVEGIPPICLWFYLWFLGETKRNPPHFGALKKTTHLNCVIARSLGRNQFVRAELSVETGTCSYVVRLDVTATTVSCLSPIALWNVHKEYIKHIIDDECLSK